MLRPRRRPLRLPALAALALFFVAAAAPRAHADEVTSLMDLIRQKPSNMDRDEWREKRRDAARKLGELGDERAVPLLMEVVEKEQFDVIAEISIESLGKLGDQRAVPTLRRVSKDPSRDRFVRQAAQKALEQIGASAGDPGPGSDPDPGGGDPDPDPDGGSGETGLGIGGQRPGAPRGPEFSEDTLASTERLTLAAGAARLRYDTIRELASLDANGAAEYERTLDREGSAYRYGGTASVIGGTADLPPEANTSNSLLLNVAAVGEARFYAGGRPMYGLVQGAAATSFVFVRVNRPGADNTRERRLGAELHAAVGGGYGRVLDVGVELRLRRIENVLRQARALGRPITPDLARRIYGAWWALRGAQGAYLHLQATIAILREAGVLLGEPDAALTYKILQVLLDGQLDRRPRGLDVYLAVAESFLLRDDDLVGGRVRDGRIETILAGARYGRQSEDGEHELVGEGFARYRIFTDSDAGEPAPWAIGATAAWRNYFYNEHYDPIGALELRGLVGLSNPGFSGSPKTSRLAAGVGWLWSHSRASRVRLAGEISLEAEEILVGVTLEAVYGLLDVGYLGK